MLTTSNGLSAYSDTLNNNALPASTVTVPLRADITHHDEAGASLWCVANANVAPVTADTTLHYGIKVTYDGTVGTPLPYSVRTDNAVISLLILCFILSTVTLATAMQGFIAHAKNFVRPYRASAIDDEPHMPFMLVLMAFQGCIMLGIASLMYFTNTLHLSPSTDNSQLVVAGLFILAFTAFYGLKWIIYSVVNEVFFGSKKRLHWNHAYIFILASQGLLLFLLVILMVFFNLQVKYAAICLVSVLILNKIATFFKSQNIFFQNNGRFLQNILYFCALEVAPLLAFGGLWIAMVQLLKVNF